MTPQIVAVDHFAGTGWGVACHALDILEYGVEKMPAAIRTRTANRFRTIYRDVWSGLFHPWLVPAHRLYIASPPCPTFSMAGGGEGREAMPNVLRAIDEERWKNVESLFAMTEEMDPRTALVLTPLAHIWAHRPELVALEQVPPVLPIWEAIARVMRTLGYSVWTGILSSETFGVPQTRKRAILMARLDGVVRPPAPTHSRYYSDDPKRLDPGVLPWVSMAEALGWGMTGQPSYTLTGGGTETGGYEPFPTGARDGMAAAAAAGEWSSVALAQQAGHEDAVRLRDAGTPAPTVTGHTDRAAWVVRTNQGNPEEGYQERESDKPSPTMTGNGSQSWNWVYRNGSQRKSAKRPVDAPAPTIMFGNSSNEVVWVETVCPSCGDPESYHDEGGFCAGLCGGNCQDPELGRPGVWNTWDGLPPVERPAVRSERPATTLGADDRVAGPGRSEFVKGGVSRQDRPGTVRVTVAEAAALQSYPAGFLWRGSKTKQFLQIGNAVPPLMARAILATLIEPAEERSPWDAVFAEVAG